jgi:hypothetical protein
MRARDNPFRTELLLRVRYRFRHISWPDLLQRCEQLNYRAALVGPRGSGKTTLLEDLDPKLREQGFETHWVRLNEEHSLQSGILRELCSALTNRLIILFDGAEQLNWLDWQTFKRRTRHVAGLIVTVHKPQRLPTLLECRTAPELLAEIIAELLGPQANQLPLRPEHLFHKHQGNLREALRECYDWFAYSHSRSNSTRSASSFCGDRVLDTANVGTCM